MAALILAIFLKSEDQDAQINAKWFAFFTALATLIASLWVVFGFEIEEPGFQFSETHAWSFGIQYRMGVDGIGVVLIAMTTFVMPILIAAAWGVKANIKQHMVAFLVLESVILGALCAADILLFFVFLHCGAGTLLFLWGLSSGWQGIATRSTALFAIIWCVSGVLTALGSVLVLWIGGTSDLATLYGLSPMTGAGAAIAFGLLLAGIIIWGGCLPLCIRASGYDVSRGAIGALALFLYPVLRIYAMMRLVLPIFPLYSADIGPVFGILCAAYMILSACGALATSGMQQALSYLAAAKAALILATAMTGNLQGYDATVLQVVALGLVFSGLFLSVGTLEHQLGVSNVGAFGGVAVKLPIHGLLFLVLAFAMIGLPGTVGFVGNSLTMFALAQANPYCAVLFAVGSVVLLAAILRLYRRIFLGDLIRESVKEMAQPSPWSIYVLLPLVLAVFLFGLKSTPLSNITTEAVDFLAMRTDTAGALADAQAVSNGGKAR